MSGFCKEYAMNSHWRRFSPARRLLGTAALILIVLGAGLAALFLVPRGHTAQIPQTYDFQEHFSEAMIQSPGPEYVGLHDDFDVGNGPEQVIYAHPATQITYSDIPVYAQGRLELAIGMHRDTWGAAGDGVTFEVLLQDARGDVRSLLSRHLDPAHDEGDRGWQPVSVDLSSVAGQRVQLVFSTTAGGSAVNDWAAWSHPQLVGEQSVPVGKENYPNVILISIDTLRADHLSAYGYERPTSPHLDQLAQEGVLFEQAYCQIVLTVPSHASMLTSLYAHTHGLYYNGNQQLSPDVQTLAEVLQEQGYSTAAVVAVNYLLPEYSGLGQGFDTFFSFSDAADWEVQRTAEEINGLAESWLTEHYRERFFLFVHYFDTHAPYLPEAPYAGLYYEGDPTDPTNHSLGGVSSESRQLAGLADDVTDLAYPIALYDAEINYTDDHVNELLEFLDLLELGDNTLVLVVSDHGEAFGEHGVYFDHWMLYDEDSHVPLIMRYPGHLPAGQRVAGLVEAGVDIAPTILALLNLPPLPAAEGRSLVPLIQGQEEVHEYVMTEMREAMAVALRTVRYKFILDRATSDYEVLAANPTIEGKRALYDLWRDPHEQRDLLGAGTRSDLGDQLAALCQEWLSRKSVQVEPGREELPAELQEMLKDLGY
jgi:arylsulfatase